MLSFYFFGRFLIKRTKIFRKKKDLIIPKNQKKTIGAVVWFGVWGVHTIDDRNEEETKEEERTVAGQQLPHHTTPTLAFSVSWENPVDFRPTINANSPSRNRPHTPPSSEGPGSEERVTNPEM